VFARTLDFEFLFAPWRLCVRLFLAVAIVGASQLLATGAHAADNELTPAEKAEGWKLLFNGKNRTGGQS
jgi:hypothetical protein